MGTDENWKRTQKVTYIIYKHTLRRELELQTKSL